MTTARQSLRAAALIATQVVGRFGATKDNSPEAFQAGIDIQGTGPGKNASRVKTGRKPFGILPSFGATVREQRTRLYQALRSSKLQSTMPGSMRGSEWLRENRRRRAAGLIQQRQPLEA